MYSTRVSSAMTRRGTWTQPKGEAFRAADKVTGRVASCGGVRERCGDAMGRVLGQSDGAQGAAGGDSGANVRLVGVTYALDAKGILILSWCLWPVKRWHQS